MSDGHRRFAIPLPRRTPVVGRGADDGETPQRGTRTLAEAVVDCAYYEAGARKGGRLSVGEALHEIDVREGGFVWIGLHDPAPEGGGRPQRRGGNRRPERRTPATRRWP